jgi:hypothetical protein
LETHVLESVEETSKIKIAGTELAVYPIYPYGRITFLVRLGVKYLPAFEKR